jgi:metal-responsive CopG/Arc/MetJ family transcriptional regulator
MEAATINLTLDNDLLEKLDFFAEKQSQTRTELISNSIKMYISQKQKLQELYIYGEKIASKGNFTEKDIFEEIKNYRKNK